MGRILISFFTLFSILNICLAIKNINRSKKYKRQSLENLIKLYLISALFSITATISLIINFLFK